MGLGTFLTSGGNGNQNRVKTGNDYPGNRPATALPSSTSTASVFNNSSLHWACTKCTYDNHPALKECEQCEMPRFSWFFFGKKKENIKILLFIMLLSFFWILLLYLIFESCFMLSCLEQIHTNYILHRLWFEMKSTTFAFGHFTIISGLLFANYINIFHKI